MNTIHFNVNGKAACGATGCYVALRISTFFVECARCQKSRAYKAAIKQDFDAPTATPCVVKSITDVLTQFPASTPAGAAGRNRGEGR